MTEIMTVKQLPIIEERLQQMKIEIQQKIDSALSLDVSEESIKEVKKVRADLNISFKELEDKRKQVKNAVLEPYNQFESVYKDCVTNIFKPADSTLAKRIAEIEMAQKEEKFKKIKAYYDEYALSLGIDFVDIKRVGLNVTLSASEKSLKASCKAFLDGIYQDLNAIDAIESRDEVMAEYKQSLDFARSVSMVKERQDRIEREKSIAEQKKQEHSVPEVKTAPVLEPLSSPVVEKAKPKQYSMQFTVRGTLEQLKELKQFMEQKGIEFNGTN